MRTRSRYKILQWRTADAVVLAVRVGWMGGLHDRIRQGLVERLELDIVDGVALT